MSIQAVAWVIEHSDATLGARNLMFAIANHADERGGDCWAAVRTLAHEARLSRTAVQKNLRKLEEAGEIRSTGTHPKYGTTIYAIAGMGGQLTSPRQPDEGEGANLTPVFDDAKLAQTVPTKPSTEPLLESTDEFDQWLADFREVTGKPKTMGSGPARKHFRARRADGYTLDDLKLATRGVHGDDWCRKNGFDRPETLLQPSKIDRYIALAGQNGHGPVERRMNDGVPQISRDGGKTWESDYEAHEEARR